MKKLIKIIAVLWMFVAAPIFAIEGLQVSITNSTNASLSWPSSTSDSYLIQYRHTINATDSWATLQDYYPPDYSGSNVTYFLDTNFVDMGTPGNYPPNTNGGGGINPTNTGGGGVPFTNAIPGTGFYRVVRDGAHMFGVTNGTVWSGVVNVPLEVAATYLPANATLDFVSIDAVDPNTGNTIPLTAGAVNYGPFNGSPFVVVDTTSLSNGAYNLVGYAHFTDTNDDEWDLQQNTPVAVITANEITFPNFIPMFGTMSNSLGYSALSAHTNVNWTANLYDSSNNFVRSFNGLTPDGNISFSWDLTDTNGVVRTNDSFFTVSLTTPYTSSSPHGNGPQPNNTNPGGVANKVWKNFDTWTAPGGWAIAVQRMLDPYNFRDADNVYTEFCDFNLADGGFVGQVGGNGGLSPYTPTSTDPGTGVFHPFELEYGPGAGSADTEWQNLRKALFGVPGQRNTTRNFVYFGHGGAAGIGSLGSADTNKFITATEVAAQLGNAPVYIPGPIVNSPDTLITTNMHYGYRFVFIDACDTAKGGLCLAFGILPFDDVTIDQYTTMALRPGAYVGWPDTKTIGYIVAGSIYYEHVYFIEHIQFGLINYGKGIADAVQKAGIYNDDPDFQNNDMVVYGFQNLTLTSYNVP